MKKITTETDSSEFARFQRWRFLNIKNLENTVLINPFWKTRWWTTAYQEMEKLLQKDNQSWVLDPLLWGREVKRKEIISKQVMTDLRLIVGMSHIRHWTCTEIKRKRNLSFTLFYWCFLFWQKFSPGYILSPKNLALFTEITTWLIKTKLYFGYGFQMWSMTPSFY